MSLPCRYIVVHYSEIALKKGNRPWFVSTLTRNIKAAVRGGGVRAVTALPGRIVLTLDPYGAEHSGRIVERLRKVFGIAWLSPGYRSPAELESMKEGVLAAVAARRGTFESFRLAARRGDKSFPISSPEINAYLGAAVQAATGARVDLDEPDLTVWVEIVHGEALYYLDRLRGPGGLPVGTAGRVVALLSGGIDSPVAAWRMMRRGCVVVFVHFHSEPYLSRAGLEKAVELAQMLAPGQLKTRLHLVAFGGIQKEVSIRTRDELRVVLYRRLMARIAEAIALEEHATALVTGEALGQVASQTLQNLAVIEEAVRLPVLRPLIAMDKEEIVAQAREIGTYDTSILPDEDCCQLFVPRHPATRSRLADVQAEEAALELPRLVQLALEGRELREFMG